MEGGRKERLCLNYDIRMALNNIPVLAVQESLFFFFSSTELLMVLSDLVRMRSRHVKYGWLVPDFDFFSSCLLGDCDSCSRDRYSNNGGND